MGTIMIDKNSDDWKMIETKAELLCFGLTPTEDIKELYSLQNPFGDWKTGNIGLHILLNNKTYVLVTVGHRFNSISPYTIGKEDGYWRLYKKSREVTKIDIISMPQWYDYKTTTGKQASKIFLHEGKHFLHMEYVGCDLFKIGNPCKFCGTGGIWRVGLSEEISEITEVALKENKNYHVCLGGGTRIPLSRNTDYFLKCLVEIRKRVGEIPIFIEMVPPESNEEILKLVNAGATSFGFNIEIWDDKLREEICPGKAFISKQRYLEAMGYALKLLGSNKVGCCLIVGLEPSESTIEGARTLASRGIQPCMLPFKPWNRSLFRNRDVCDPKVVLHVGEKVAQFMNEFGIDPTQNHGCLNCEACTIEHNILELIKNGGDKK